MRERWDNFVYNVREAGRALREFSAGVALLGGVLIVLFGVVLASAADMRKMNKQIDDTNFLVNTGCSGTLIDGLNGYVLTAYHCVDTQYETVEKEKIADDGTVKKEKVRVARPGRVSLILYKGPNEVQRNAYVYKLKATDSALDLALLKVQSKLPGERGAAKMACGDVVRGDKVYAVGNSYAVLYSTLTEGIVSSVTRSYRDLQLEGDLGDLTDDGEHGLTQHSAVIAGGNSGGALYNDSGDLVGVNVRGAASGFSFAVPMEDIRKFLSSNGAEHLYKHCDK